MDPLSELKIKHGTIESEYYTAKNKNAPEAEIAEIQKRLDENHRQIMELIDAGKVRLQNGTANYPYLDD